MPYGVVLISGSNEENDGIYQFIICNDYHMNTGVLWSGVYHHIHNLPCGKAWRKNETCFYDAGSEFADFGIGNSFDTTDYCVADSIGAFTKNYVNNSY